MTCSRMPKRDLAPGRGGQGPHLAHLLGGHGRRLAPHQPRVGVAGGHPLAGVGRAPEEDRRLRVGRRRHRGALDPVVVAGEVEGRAAPRAPHDLQELGGAGVAGVLVEEVAEAALLLAAAPGHDVEQQPAARQPLERDGLLGGQGRRHRPRPEGDEEPQAGGLGEQRRGRHPGVLAPRAGGREHGVEADLLGRPRHLGQVVEAGRATARRGAEADDVAAVAGGGQEPVDGERHGGPLGQSVRADKADRFSHVSIRPTARAQPKSDQFRQLLAIRAPPAPRRRPPGRRAPPPSGRPAPGATTPARPPPAPAPGTRCGSG